MAIRIEQEHTVTRHMPKGPVSALMAALVFALALFGLSGSAGMSRSMLKS